MCLYNSGVLFREIPKVGLEKVFNKIYPSVELLEKVGSLVDSLSKLFYDRHLNLQACMS